jgi:hypothetical protein
MDELPSISALRDEESPPPRDSSPKYRIKPPKRPSVDADRPGNQDVSKDLPMNEDELEEDQLIDDDELAPDSSAAPSTSTAAAASKKSPAKKPRASKKQSKHNPVPVFMVSTLEVGPSQGTQALQTTEDSWIPVQPFNDPSAPTQPKPRRKPAVKKEKPPPKPRKNAYVSLCIYFATRLNCLYFQLQSSHGAGSSRYF